MLNNWQRIEQIIKWAGVSSVNAFAREIGLNRGENLYQIKRGNNGISRDLAETVTTKYPAVSKAWLLTGEGEMLPAKSAKLRNEIPFFKLDAVDLLSMAGEKPAKTRGRKPGEEDNSFPEPECFVSFPMIKGCDLAAFTLSDAMQPEIPNGATVFLKKVEAAEVVPGNTYLVISRGFKGIRTVRTGGKDTFRLVPRDLDNFDEVNVPAADIERIYQVKGQLVTR